MKRRACERGEQEARGREEPEARGRKELDGREGPSEEKN